MKEFVAVFFNGYNDPFAIWADNPEALLANVKQMSMLCEGDADHVVAEMQGGWPPDTILRVQDIDLGEWLIGNTYGVGENLAQYELNLMDVRDWFKDHPVH